MEGGGSTQDFSWCLIFILSIGEQNKVTCSRSKVHYRGKKQIEENEGNSSKFTNRTAAHAAHIAREEFLLQG